MLLLHISYKHNRHAAYDALASCDWFAYCDWFASCPYRAHCNYRHYRKQQTTYTGHTHRNGPAAYDALASHHSCTGCN